MTKFPKNSDEPAKLDKCSDVLHKEERALTHQIMCCGLDLTFVLLGRVAQTEDFLLAELGVVVELHLRVQAEI